MADDNVINLSERRQWPDGPFTVTIANADGKLFEATFPNYSGELPRDAAILGTGGIPHVERLIVNLLAGALRAFAGGI